MPTAGGRPQARTRARAVVLVALVLVFAGCGGGSDRRAHLVVGTSWGGAGNQALQRELIRIANDLGPVSIEVRGYGMASLNDYVAHTQRRGARDALDLAIVPHEWLAQLTQRETIGELPSERVVVLRQRLLGQALLAVSEGERVFGYPISAEVVALVYDPGAFPYPPRSIDEILAGSYAPGELPFALDLSNPTVLAPLVGSLQGGIVDPEGNLAWRPEAVKETLRRLHPAWGTPGGWRVCRGSDLQSLQVQLFAAGKLASFVAGPWLLQALEDTGHPFAVMPIPGFSGATPARALVGYQCAVVLRDSRWGDLALEIGARLLREETNERINLATGHLPVLLSAYESRRGVGSAGSFGFLRALEQGKFAPSTASWGEALTKAQQQLAGFVSRPQPPRIEGTPDFLPGSAQ